MTAALLSDPTTEPEKRTEPPKKWRNVWRKAGPAGTRCVRCGWACEIPFGTIFRSHCAVFPSRELAEQCASEAIALSRSRGVVPNEWLDAEPVE